ncbi:OLC1v1002151C1 [Oldenlandia corymbosa var. corymbosa]|uniref:OLC1v1002151C1 n=1 Tax=Oldenlandia corymbosa var. corymbosa TaxID=529605 RepID=A0AAV1D6Z4_OLDCO|nr:OLC1v1002151C1 [Oldenlandia corymbosa var. corymbosa]
MAGSKAIATVILLNVIFFAFVSSSNATYCPPSPKTPVKPPSVPAPAKKPAKCPKDTLKFGVCGDWLGLVHEVVGTPPSSECCALIKGLADLEAAVCLCTAIKANVLGVVKVKIPIAISLLINGCGKKVPEGFKC